MKRLLSFVLVTALCLSLVPACVTAAPIYEKGFDYEKINGGTEAEIVTYYGLGDSLVIPETLGGLPVTSVRDGAVACQPDTQIRTLSLPSGLTNFSANAILNNTSLESITLAEGNTAFKLVDGVLFKANMTQLVLYPAGSWNVAYEVPGGVRTIGEAAFYGAKNLINLRLPDSLKTIVSNSESNYSGVFENCSGLKTIRIPATTESIGDYAFMGCTSLVSVTFPNSSAQLKIGMGAFLNCPNLTSVRLYPNVSSIGMEAFGYINYLNDADILVSKQVDGFEIYSIDHVAGAQYAKNCGMIHRKMTLMPFAASDVILCGPEEGATQPILGAISSIQYDTLDDALFLEQVQENFPEATSVVAVSATFTPKSGTIIGDEFEEEILYSLPIPRALDTTKDVYAFYVDAEGNLEYVSTISCESTGIWGYYEPRLLLETEKIGSFVFVTADVLPGDVNLSGEVEVGDLATLAKSLAGWDISTSVFNSDVDGSGECGIADLANLAKFMAGWRTPLYSFGETV